MNLPLVNDLLHRGWPETYAYDLFLMFVGRILWVRDLYHTHTRSR
jgi:hypothetical protein